MKLIDENRVEKLSGLDLATKRDGRVQAMKLSHKNSGEAECASKHTKLKTKIRSEANRRRSRREADLAHFAREAGDRKHIDWVLVFVVLTAMSGDSARCLPVLLCDDEYDRVLSEVI